ncbi:MAG: hypothetical protein K940chlam1_01091 [Candidatus Anoxychlamydiales bacterium]|nr:hypothetical protein [Candidatus Anoxychlamydiales bacterium]NGX36029.1 hypothetical protein [Candidatus Anoxychlamydiales bacterium]
MKKIWFILSMVVLFNAYAHYSHEGKYIETNPNKGDFIVLTIPKSGSYLLNKCLILAIDKHIKNKNPKLTYNLQHCYISSNYYSGQTQVLQKLRTKKKIVMIRDLRDVAVSLTNYLTLDIIQSFCKMFPNTNYEYLAKWYNNLSYDDRLFSLINSDRNVVPLNHMKTQSNSAVYWMNTPNTYICKYEDLIGPQGNGTREKQLNEIENIVQFLELDLKKEDVNFIADNLYGDSIVKTFTFRGGGIGQWENTFQLEHVKAFKEKLGKYLIEWGYEKDNNW